MLALAILLASGRLVPRCLQRQSPTASDIFLIASLLNALALFITDVMTYNRGGMAADDADAPEPTTTQIVELKKVDKAALPPVQYERLTDNRYSSLETTSTILAFICQN